MRNPTFPFPCGGPEMPLLLFLPAMGVPASFYAAFSERLRAIGVELAMLELPGQGTSPLRANRGDDYGYREVVEELIPEAVQRLAAEHPHRPLLLGGHSLGGQLAVLASHDLAQRVDGLVLVAAGTAHWRAWPAGRRLRAALTVHAISAVARLLPWYPGRRLGFGGDQPARLMRDWSRNACTGVYGLEGSDRTPEDLRWGLSGVDLPVLSVQIEGDPVAPPGAAQELCGLLPAASVSSVTVPGVATDAAWRRHFSWAREAAGVEAALSGWLAHAPSRAVDLPSINYQGVLRHVMA